MKTAGNATVFGLDHNHAVIDKRTGSIVLNGGQDAILDQITGKHYITKIRDTKKDYVIDIYVPKGKNNHTTTNKHTERVNRYLDEVDKTQRKGVEFEPNLEKYYKVAPFLRHP